jgi:hypothetical protein
MLSHSPHLLHATRLLTDIQQLASSFGKYFEKIVNMFERIGDVLPRFRVYQSLFSNHQRLLHALSQAYYDIIYFCTLAKCLFHKGKKSPGIFFLPRLQLQNH